MTNWTPNMSGMWLFVVKFEAWEFADTEIDSRLNVVARSLSQLEDWLESFNLRQSVEQIRIYKLHDRVDAQADVTLYGDTYVTRDQKLMPREIFERVYTHCKRRFEFLQERVKHKESDQPNEVCEPVDQDGPEFVLIVGNVIDGIQVHGTFRDPEDAGEYAENDQYIRDTTWWVTELLHESPPADSSELNDSP